MRFTVLCENTSARPGIVAEHGFSLLIEGDHLKVLFDMGQTNVFAANAAAMNLSLADVNYAILSHGHYDHSGGLRKFLEINKTAPVYVSYHAFEPHYSANGYIGMDPALAENIQPSSFSHCVAL